MTGSLSFLALFSEKLASAEGRCAKKKYGRQEKKKHGNPQRAASNQTFQLRPECDEAFSGKSSGSLQSFGPPYEL
jgi:hypothetical protein